MAGRNYRDTRTWFERVARVVGWIGSLVMAVTLGWFVYALIAVPSEALETWHLTAACTALGVAAVFWGLAWAARRQEHGLDTSINPARVARMKGSDSSAV